MIPTEFVTTLQFFARKMASGSVVAVGFWGAMWLPSPSQAQPKSPTPAAEMSSPAASSDSLANAMERARLRLAEAKDMLAEGKTGTETQAAQADTILALDQMIAAAQRQEAAERQAGGANGAGRTRAPQPMPTPSATDEDRQENQNNPSNVMSPAANGPPGAWGKLPPQEREKLLRTLGDRGFPTRYRQQLEAYYRSLRTPPTSTSPVRSLSPQERPSFPPPATQKTAPENERNASSSSGSKP